MKTDNYYKKKVYKIGNYRKNAILKFINKPNPFVLDIGCGDGGLGMCIKESKGGKVYGIDISESAVKEARLKIDKAFCLNIESDKWSEDILNNKYDFIIVSEVLEHLFKPENILEILKKISHKDTEIIITVPNVLYWINRVKILLGNFDYKDSGLMDRGHIHFFSWKSFNKMVSDCGFRVTSENNKIPTVGTKLLGKIFPGLFSYQFVVKIKQE